MTEPRAAADSQAHALRALGDPAGNLAAFMGRHGHTPDDLLAQMSTLLGEPSLAVASGSVVVGYANQKSDVDLYAIGDVPDTQRVPIISHELGPLIDISLIDQDQLRQQLTWLKESPQVLAVGGAVADQWRTTRRVLHRALRLAYGVVLRSTPEWAAIQASLRVGWLADKAVIWWRLEARRRLVTARWLERVNPALAAQLACEAQLYALKAVTAEAGYAYPHQKWVSTELHAMGRDDLLALYRQALHVAWDVTVPVRDTDKVVDGLIGPPPANLVMEAAYVPGVATHRLRDSTLVSRWELRGGRLDTTQLPAVRHDGRAIWRGGLEETPPEWLRQLAALGMVWIGVGHAAP
jgi:hypothetical protein